MKKRAKNKLNNACKYFDLLGIDKVTLFSILKGQTADWISNSLRDASFITKMDSSRSSVGTLWLTGGKVATKTCSVLNNVPNSSVLYILFYFARLNISNNGFLIDIWLDPI